MILSSISKHSIFPLSSFDPPRAVGSHNNNSRKSATNLSWRGLQEEQIKTMQLKLLSFITSFRTNAYENCNTFQWSYHKAVLFSQLFFPLHCSIQIPGNLKTYRYNFLLWVNVWKIIASQEKTSSSFSSSPHYLPHDSLFWEHFLCLKIIENWSHTLPLYSPLR